MISNINLYLIKRLFRIISKKSKSLLLLGIFTALISGFFEAMILRKLPFFIQELANANDLDTLSSGFILIIFSILAMFTRLTAIYIATKCSEIIGTELSIKAYETVIRMPYKIILEQNLENISAKIQHISKIVGGIIRPFQETIYYLIISTIIIYNAILINKNLTITAILLVFSYYLIITYTSRNFVKKISINTGIFSSALLQDLINSLRSIRTIKLEKNEVSYINRYKKIDQSLRKFVSKAVLITSTPKFILENLIIISTVLIIIINSKFGENSFTLLNISNIAVLVVAFQKLLPSFQQIYGNITVIRNNEFALKDLFDLIDFKKSKINKKLKISTEFNENKNLISRVKYSNLNKMRGAKIELFYGDNIAINAPSGSGKSTFIDILMGLREDIPCEIIFNKNTKLMKNTTSALDAFNTWQNQISCVSQEILIPGESFEEIITGNKNKKFNENKFKECLEIVELKNLNTRFQNMPKLKVNIGLQGGLISGGERQRLAIARAIYRNKRFLFLDEATSNLDEELSKRILSKIIKNQNFHMVIAIIHNKNLLNLFDRVIKI